MPTYATSVFKLPNNICKELGKIIKSYCWGQWNNKKGYAGKIRVPSSKVKRIEAWDLEE